MDLLTDYSDIEIMKLGNNNGYKGLLHKLLLSFRNLDFSSIDKAFRRGIINYFFGNPAAILFILKTKFWLF